MSPQETLIASLVKYFKPQEVASVTPAPESQILPVEVGPVEKAARHIREDVYPAVRNAAHDALLQPGGKGTHQTAKDYFHRQGNKVLTEKIATILPPRLAANVADSMYLGNEVMSGTLASIAGEPFFSDYGFRWKDVAINRKGQDQAVSELEARQALQRAIEDRTPYNVR